MKVPPGPRGLEVFEFFGGGSAARTLAFLERTARRYGPISSMRILNQRVCLIDDADLIKEVLVTGQHSYTRDSGATLLRELVGDGLLTSEEPRHRERRRILQPAFHREQISSYAGVMAVETARMERAWTSGAEVDLGREMKRLTLAIVGATLFGADFGGCADRIAEILQRVIHRSARIAPVLALVEPLLLAYRRMRPRAKSLFFSAERTELERTIAPVLAERRSTQTRDMLSLLLSQRDDEDQPLSDADIQNELVTLVLAGHETTATALTWAWYLIAQHPMVESRLQQEVDEVLGERPVTLEDIPSLTYTSAVFAEALRLYPPAAAFGRRPKEEVTLGGYQIQRGTSVLISPYITHRNERYFPKPLEFDPDRWSREAPPKFAYFPFGGGAKMCIGDAFAKMEGVIALATVAQRWTLRWTGNAAVGVSPGVTLRPDRPVMMQTVLRSTQFADSDRTQVRKSGKVGLL